MKWQPIALQLIAGDQLEITWNDQQTHRIPIRVLRTKCPCATCRELRQAPTDPLALPVLKREETQPLRIASMRPVGNYAYSIGFSDGHDTGIFTLDFLRELGDPPA